MVGHKTEILVRGKRANPLNDLPKEQRRKILPEIEVDEMYCRIKLFWYFLAKVVQNYDNEIVLKLLSPQAELFIQSLGKLDFLKIPLHHKSQIP